MHPPPRGRRYWSRELLIYNAILAVPSLAASWIIFGWTLFDQGLPTFPRELRSKITAETPISGFYGPGSWLAWLITLGMSHGNMIKALLTTGALPEELDYDLIGASCYTVAAAIDLIRKSRTIAQLGDAASASVLLPALACAEFVVWLGGGSSLVTMLTALFLGRSEPSGFRIAGIAGIPLMFAFVASGFTLHAHQAIAQTAPVFWCVAHNATQPPGTREYVIFGHFPASIATQWKVLSQRYCMWAGTIMGAVLAVVFVWEMLEQRTLRRAPRKTILTGILSVLPFIPWFELAFIDTMWFLCWVAFWWPVYILAFFPQMGYFPITGMSLLEMDQTAALLAVAVVAAIRILRSIFKAIRPLADSDSSLSHEVAPLLPVSIQGDRA
ncbi:hypothetical protein FB451DRAFT_1215731 [Mycena latifolia]|nr:hypothetical protein FB451DRAFT_1215731 [Mycena latifolia]